MVVELAYHVSNDLIQRPRHYRNVPPDVAAFLTDIRIAAGKRADLPNGNDRAAIYGALLDRSEIRVDNASWGKLAADFLLKRDDPERLRTFVNRFLGQGWHDDLGTLDESQLAARAEPFGLDAIPEVVISITVGVDVQDDRLEATLVGWAGGHGMLR